MTTVSQAGRTAGSSFKRSLLGTSSALAAVVAAAAFTASPAHAQVGERAAPMMLEPAIPVGQPSLPPSGAPGVPQPGGLPPSAPSGDQHQIMASSAGSVVTLDAAPVVAARQDGTVSAQGTPTVVAGNVTFSRSATKDQVQVNTQEAVVNWTTFDTDTLATTDSWVNFLPAGTELEFVGLQGEYTILNRIFSAPDTFGEYRGIAFEGTVTSRLVDAGPIGGTVWFYSPGGILLTDNAAFNVGSLVLTTSDIAQIDSAGTQLNFLGVSQPDSSILIGTGATIDAENYVAMWAPRIEQAGTVRANGNISYTAAEQGQLTVSGTLFDMTVTVGTEDANGIVHTGTTSGPSGATDTLRAISMNAVGKDDFITMLVGGNIGYDEPTAANVLNGVVILSAESNGADATGNIEFGNTQIDSLGVAQASGGLSLKVDGQNSTLAIGSLNNPVDFIAIGEQSLDVAATGGASIIAFGSMLLGAGANGVGGTVNITVDDAGRDNDSAVSGLLVNGTLTVSARGVGASDLNAGGIGGDGVGGTVNIDVSQGGEIVATNNFVVNAGAQSGFGLAQSGTATAGDITFNVTGANSRVFVGGSISLDASADAAIDPNGEGALPETGNDAFGGSIVLNFADGIVASSDIQIDVSASATDGFLANAGESYDAQAGSIDFTNNASLAATLIDLAANASGGDGGDGVAGQSGQAGGSATGGDISFVSTVDLPNLVDLSISANATGGTGGLAGQFGNGGAGGNATAGSARFEVQGTGPLLGAIADIFIEADGVGGAGTDGGAGDATLASGDGGAGGSGTGGTAALAISGPGATFSVDPQTMVLSANGFGGAAGNGAGNAAGGVAGNGGAGGDGFGGTTSIEVGSGATVTLLPTADLNFVLGATGSGGTGGVGGGTSIDLGGFTGLGGDGGSGTGGSPTIIATGGTIIAPIVELDANGFGGFGGQGGDLGRAPDGNGGAGNGGTPLIQTLDGSPGVLTLGTVTINASGLAGGGTVVGSTAGGSITIVDGSADPAGLITMVDLIVNATGTLTTPGTPSLTIESSSGPITVLNNASANVGGDIVFDFDGDGQFVVGGSANLTAGGNIVATHTNNGAGLESVDTGLTLFANASGNIDLQPGAIVSAGEIFLISGGNIDADDLRAEAQIVAQAAGNVTIRDAIATGPQGPFNGAGIFIDAGFQSALSGSYDTAVATITGTVDSFAAIEVRSGGNAVFATGSTTAADEYLLVQTGDDIIVETGATLIAARNPAIAPNPADPFNASAVLDLQAGALAPLLISVPATPIASLVVDGTLDATGSAIIAEANAIDGLDGSFIASSIALDINDAPNAGLAQSDDAGLLSASCLEGNICVGNIVADNIIEIGQASNNDTIQLIIEQGTVDANEILITTRDDIVMGTNGIATTLNAANLFSATSLAGDVNLFDAAISSGLVVIDAAGSLLGTADIASTGDVGITVGQDVFATSITAGGEITSAAGAGGAPEGFFSLPGSMVVDAVSVGTGNFNVSAGGDIILGTVVVPGTDINLSAGGLAQLDFADTATNVQLDGGSVVFGTIDASGNIDADSLSTIDLLDLIAGGDITLIAGDAVTGGDLDAGGTLSITGSSIAIGDGSANIISLLSGTDILFDSLLSASGIALRTADGVIGANVGPGDVTTTGVGAGISLIAGGATGDIVVGAVTTDGGDILLSAGRDLSIGSAATGAGVPSAASIALLAAGNVSSSGTLAAGEDIAVAALGDVTLGDLGAGDDITIDASGAVSFDTASTSGAGIDTFSLVLDPALAGQLGSIVFAAEDANLVGSTAEFSAGGLMTGVQVDAAGDVSLQSGVLVVDEVLSGGDVDIAADAGTLDVLNLIADGDVTLSALDSITVDHLEATGSLFATGGDDFTTGLNSIITGGDIVISVDDIVDLGNSSAGGLVDVTGSQIDYVSLSAGETITLLAQITPNTRQGNGNISGGTTTAGDGASSMTASDGSITLSGDTLVGATSVPGNSLALSAAGDIAVALVDVLGNFSASSGGTFTFDNIGTDGIVDIFADGAITGTGGIDAGTNVFLFSINGSIAMVDVVAGDAISIFTTGDVDATTLDAGNFVDVTSGGTVTVADVVTGTGGPQFVSISGDQGIDIGTLTSGAGFLTSSAGPVSVATDILLDDVLQVFGESIFLRSTHDLAVTADASVSTIDIETSGNLDVQGASAPGDIRLVSTGGSTFVNDVLTLDSAPPSGFQGTQQVTTSGGNILIGAAVDVVVNSLVSVAGNLQIDAGGLVELQALASGVLIDVISSDITIGSAGALGESDRTDAITLLPLASDVTLGGSGGSSGYELDGDEFSRIFSGGDVTVDAGDLDGFVTIDDLSVIAGAGTSATDGNIGQSGTLSIIGGDIDVIGSLGVSDATSDTGVFIGASNLITVDFLSGNIGLFDANSAFTGVLDMSAFQIEAISSSARSDIAGASLDQINLRLGDSEGNSRPDGFFQAGTIGFSVDNALFIQNTGDGIAFDDRRGFVADEVFVFGPVIDIVINGIVAGQTGIDALELVNLDDVTASGRSTINGCLIARPSLCVISIITDDNDFPTREEIDRENGKPDGNDKSGQGFFDTMLVELRENPLTADDPLIDEPVTGAGNEDLWSFEPECDPADGEPCETGPSE